MKVGTIGASIVAAAAAMGVPMTRTQGMRPRPPIFGLERGRSYRAGLRYSRNDMHAQQQRSHDPSWQAMNKHIKAHLYGETS